MMRQERLIDRKIIAAWFWFVLILLLVGPFWIQQAWGADFDVPSVYGTVQSAIDAAMTDVTPDGETHVIRVIKNTIPYYENLLIKPSSFGGSYTLTLQGGWAHDFSSMDTDPSATIVDGNSMGSVVTIKSQRMGLTFVLENLTLQNGKNTATTGGGGGIHISASSFTGGEDLITIRNNIIRNNIAEAEFTAGGGIFGYSSSLSAHQYEIRIINNTIYGNEARTRVGGGGAYFTLSERGQPYTEPGLDFSNNQVYGNKVIFPDQGTGGGLNISLYDDTSALIKENNIHDNSSNDGAGVYLSSHDSTTISFVKNQISGNTASDDHGGFNAVAWDDSLIILAGNTVFANQANGNGGGGGIFADDTSTIDLAHGFILNNTAASVGGLYVSGSGTLSVTNHLIAGNETSGPAGGIYVSINGEGSLEMHNTTIADNFSLENYSGGQMYIAGSAAYITARNNIIWNNLNADNENDSSFFLLGELSNINFSYSDYDEIYSITPWSGTNNIQQDPLFTAGPLPVGGNENYYLSNAAAGQIQDSPCIDMGSEPAASSGLDTLTTRSDQVTDSGIVDMGFHYPLVTSEDIPGDGDGDGDVDGSNLADFAAAYASAPGDSNYAPVFDLDGIPGINAGDLTIISRHFGT